MIKNFLKIILFISIFSLLRGEMFADCEAVEVPLQTKVITNSVNNIREGACKTANLHGKTKIGITYDVVAEAGEYYKVMIDGQARYIFKEGVDLVNENKELGQANAETPKTSEVSFEDEIGKYWLSLYNGERVKLGLKPYTYDNRLQNSAKVWAKISSDRGYSSHKRSKGDSYYDFWKIQNWFKNNGVNCKIENGNGAVENIGYGIAFCESSDCLEETKKAVKTTFDGYMKEKGKKNASHYKSITSPNLNHLGFGVYKKEIKPNVYGIYNVTHLCTSFN
ncbi:hypothetical protein D8B46_00225 [Candidatus Gracilibacteria bacterium]|nr:MAG: hypothetical protein D8B46_00225 [Candidatus Gracilibacteria bacterium]